MKKGWFVLICGLALLWPVAWSEEGGPVTLNFANADIEGVIKLASELTGRRFIVDPRVKGTINIYSAQPMPRNLVYPTLLAALRLQGFAAVEANGVVRIVPEADARQQAAVVLGGGGSNVVTRVFNLRHESATAIANALKPMLPAGTPMTAYPGNNTLVITDYAENLQRVERILDALDVPSPDEAQVIPLNFVSAVDLAPLLQQLTAEPGKDIPAPTIVAEPRSNSLLVRSPTPGGLMRIRELISKLDREESGGNIRVVYLKNAVAADVADILRNTLSGQNPSSSKSSKSTTVSATADNTQPTTASTIQSTTSALVAGSSIQADEANNALIITAPEATFRNLRAVIDLLDKRPAQVYVEALIVELSSENAADIGVQWQALGGLGKDGTQVIGGTNFRTSSTGNILDVAQNPLALGTGLNLGVVKGTISVNGKDVYNLGFLARLLESKSHANILSTPNLMTLDNQEAKIVVGQNVPFVTGQYAQTSGSTTPSPFQTIERKDVGLSLSIKPQVSEGGYVRLKIAQEVSSVVATSLTSALGPTTTKRAIESNVLVEDGGILVLGGLIEDTVTRTEDKVPLLGDIPLLGRLFRSDSQTRSKTNLLVFLRPHVLRTAQDSQRFSVDRYDYLYGVQQKTNEQIPEDNPPVLPAAPTIKPDGVAPAVPTAATRPTVTP